MKISIYLCLLSVALVSSANWPTPTKTISSSSPITVKAGQTYDGFIVNNGQWVRYDRGLKDLGDCKSIEGGNKDAVFILEKGATLKNVVLGAGAIEHVHCVGEGCTVENVWWEDVCEDALTLRDGIDGGAKYYLKGGGARNGSDKIVQHNSAGTVYISDFTVENSGKLYRSCGNCHNGYQGTRNVYITNVTGNNVKVMAGINRNYGDIAKFQNVNINSGHQCQLFKGNNQGQEPTSLGYGCEEKSISTCTCR